LLFINLMGCGYGPNGGVYNSYPKVTQVPTNIQVGVSSQGN